MMLIGDFNARPGLEHGGNRYTNTEYINSQISRTRRNFNGLINFSGQKLIELCKSNNLYILNGRKEGDTLGRFTTIQNKHLVPLIMLSLHVISFKKSPTSL